jgi:amino acid adenylation domain-containing protein
MQEAGEQIVGELEYATALFDHTTARRYIGYWRSMLEAMVKDDAQSVARLPLLGHEERRQLLEDWNATRVDYSNAKSVHELFEAQVEHSPDATALEHDGHSLTYGELNTRANRLAHHLRGLGVGPEERVAVCAERGIEAVVALLGTLKAGGVYVPLDPGSPPQRLAYMLEDCSPVVVLALDTARVAQAASSVAATIVHLKSDAAEWAHQGRSNPNHARVDARSLAYIIYTSGSTGLPKGVAVEHGSLTSQIRALQARYDLAAKDRLLQFVGLTFDVSLEEIFGALLSGACLILRTDEWLASGQPFWQLSAAHGVTILNLPTLFWQQAGEAGASGIPAQVRAVIIGGDAVQRTALSAWFGRSGHLPRLYNAYGPTETTINATIDEPSPESLSVSSIGRPIINGRIFVLDVHGQPAPSGVAGELYIGGAGVARGYLDSAEMTAERFLPDPFSDSSGVRLYRTGDLGRWLPDGRIEFLGRNDYQVKLRGFRIELGEIEARLATHSDVNDALVVAREDNGSGKRLIAYYTGGEIGAQALRDHVSAALPDYMVPSAYVRLEAFPLTASGKVDRQSLPLPDDQSYSAHGYQPPQGKTENQLAQIWGDLLGIERVGRHDNFFEIGGHSLLATMLIVRVQQDMAVDIGLADVFKLPELALLAEHIVNAQLAEFDAEELAEMAASLNASSEAALHSSSSGS